MPGFGPFANVSDALQAACKLILTKPHATTGRPTDPNFTLRWRLSEEYCAWLYYTPDDKFEMSLLTNNPIPGPGGMKQCDLPAWVDDPRYSPDTLGYVFMLHNHPYDRELSDRDLISIIRMAREHGGWTIKTRRREIPMGIVAFFSSSIDEPIECSGVYQYFPLTGEVFKWTSTRSGTWGKKLIASVTWTGPDDYRIETR